MLYKGLMFYFYSIFVFQKFKLVLMNNDCFTTLSKYNKVKKKKLLTIKYIVSLLLNRGYKDV